MGQYGMSTQQHDAIDKSALDKYFERVYARADRYKGGVIVDAFSGGGRDIIELYKRLDRDGKFVAIDSEAQKVLDMLSKNKQIVDELDAAFELAIDQEDLDRVLRNDWIAAVQSTFPDRTFTTDAKKGELDLKADFMLCNAGIMFVKPEDINRTLWAMTDMLAPAGELALRFSLARDDKKDALGKSYFIHDPDMVMESLSNSGLVVRRWDDLPDPDGRPFKWVDIQAICPK